MRDQRLIRCIILGVAWLSVVAGCSRPPNAFHEHLNSAPAKATCDEATLSGADGFKLVDHRLVPYSDRQFGTLASYDGGGFLIDVHSGGFADELTEPYDDLRPVHDVQIGSQSVELLIGGVLDRRVHMVIWRVPGVDLPCDLFAVVGSEVTDDQFDRALRALRPPS